MGTQHKIDAVWVQDADLGAEIEVEITFTYLRGMPETGPTYASGGEPATAPEVDFISAKANIGMGDTFDDMRQKFLNDWASDWLQDEGFAAACAVGEDYLNRGPED